QALQVPRLQSGRLDDVGPALHFARDERVELLGILIGGFIALALQQLNDVRHTGDLLDLGRQKRDDLAWSTSGCAEAIPSDRFVAGTGLSHCGYLGQDGRALQTGNGDCAKAATANEWHCERE